MKRILMILIAFSYIYIVFAVEGGVPEIAGQVKIFRDKYWVAHELC